MANQQSRKRRAKRVKNVYVTKVTIEPGAFDFTMIASRHRYDEQANTWIADEEASITMPIGVVKQAAFYLASHLSAHQQKYGFVPLSAHQIPTKPTADQVGDYAASSLEVFHGELFQPEKARAMIDAAMTRALVGMTTGPGN